MSKSTLLMAIIFSFAIGGAIAFTAQRQKDAAAKTHGGPRFRSLVTGFSPPLGDGKPLNPCRDGDGFYIARGFSTSKLCGKDFDPYGISHLGEDWNGETGGNTDLGEPVYSIADGKVIMSGRGEGCWGPVVVIEHTAPPGAPYKLRDGSNTTMVCSLYAHFSEVEVANGDLVKEGQRIGRLGKDCCECMAHLHFEIVLDPLAPIPGPGYFNAQWCTDEWCGRISPSEFIRLNALRRQPTAAGQP